VHVQEDECDPAVRQGGPGGVDRGRLMDVVAFELEIYAAKQPYCRLVVDDQNDWSRTICCHRATLAAVPGASGPPFYLLRYEKGFGRHE
jgi:hypothetical protein